MEIWEQIERYPEYEASTRGHIYSIKSGVILKPFLTNSGYLQVKLWHDGRHVHEYIHRLVAETFLHNYNGSLQVNHIDGDKLNNCVDNLEWVTHKENIRHAIDSGLFTPYKLPPHPHEGKRVKIVETGEVFESLTECANYIGGFKTAISACLLGKVKTHKGYHFEEA